jgi:DNA invertase Pin-like site-specific DNA recombinase
MYEESEWKRIHELFDAGISKSGIARRLGMRRTTVTRLLTLPAPPRRKEDRAASRRASGSARSSGRPITVLPPVTRPASPEQRAQMVRTLAALLLTHMEPAATSAKATRTCTSLGSIPIRG